MIYLKIIMKKNFFFTSLLKIFEDYFQVMESTVFQVNFVIYYITKNLNMKLNSLHRKIFWINDFSLNFVMLLCSFGHSNQKMVTLEGCICKV